MLYPVGIQSSRALLYLSQRSGRACLHHCRRLQTSVKLCILGLSFSQILEVLRQRDMPFLLHSFISLLFCNRAVNVILQVAYNPQVLLPCSKLGDTAEVLVQDASALAGPEEELSFWQLQVMLSPAHHNQFASAKGCIAQHKQICFA